MIDSRTWLKDQQVVPMAALIERIAGGKVKGSWWGHPAGKEIFRVASALEDDPTVLVAKLVDGKITFIDEALFAPIYRIVTDPKWRKARIAGLGEEARALLALVPAKSAVRIDDLARDRGVSAKALAKPREAIERSMLVHVASVHTERGHHTAVLEPWSSWAGPAVKRDAKALTFTRASALLEAALDERGRMTNI